MLDSCGIVYCATQVDAVEMVFVLKEQGIPSTFYHAELDCGEYAQNAANGTVNVICCTNAFGIEIDKQNVKFVRLESFFKFGKEPDPVFVFFKLFITWKTIPSAELNCCCNSL